MKQAQQRVANEKKKQNEKKRKAENHHKYIMGGIIVKYFPDCYRYDEGELNRILSVALQTRECQQIISKIKAESRETTLPQATIPNAENESEGVSMTFRVGDMGGLRLNEEETVILLSNLLDNAIHECVKVVRQGRNAIIHVKLVQEGGKLIFSVRNPVVEKEQIIEGTGLSNVKAVADKYGGDFAVYCDAEKF